ncbi:MAG: hypothetical protein AB8C84_06460 [Oligoflexales bacterium]
MKAHKHFIEKFLAFILASMSFTLGQAAVLDDLTQSADHAINSVTSSLESLIGKKEHKKKGRRIGFHHFGFFKSHALSDQNKISAKIFTSQKQLNHFLRRFQPESVIQKPINFEKEMILAVETTNPQSWAIQIKKLYFQDYFSFNLHTKNMTATCHNIQRARARAHLIRIKKPKERILQIKKFEMLGEKNDIECPPQEDRSLHQSFHHRILMYSKTSTQTLPQPSLSVLSYQWGEWDIFKKRHCPTCSVLYAPGLPKTASIIGVIDQAPLSKETGRAQLILHQLQATQNKWVVHLERIINLCHRAPRNSPLIVFATPPNHSIKSVQIASGFIGESQKVCSQNP